MEVIKNGINIKRTPKLKMKVKKNQVVFDIEN